MVTPAENDLIEALIAAGQNATSIRAAVPTVSRTNIYLKMAKYRKHGTVSRIETKPIGRPRLLTNDTEKFLLGLMAAKPGIELEEMQGHVLQVLGLSVSTSTISRTISRSGLGVRGRGRGKVARASAKVMWKGGHGGQSGQSGQSPGGRESEEPGEGFDDADELQADELQTEALSMGRGRAGSAPPGPVMGPVSLAHATGRGAAARRMAEADAVAAAASSTASTAPPPPPTATNNFAPAPLPQSLPYSRQEPAPPRPRFNRPSAQLPPQRSIWEDDGLQIEHLLDPSLVSTPALPQAPKRRGVPRYGVPGTTSGAVDTPVAPVAPMTARVYHSPYPPVA